MWIMDMILNVFGLIPRAVARDRPSPEQHRIREQLDSRLLEVAEEQKEANEQLTQASRYAETCGTRSSIISSSLIKRRYDSDLLRSADEAVRILEDRINAAR